MNTRADVVVIGGGVGGALAAIHLARSGAKTVLLEKAAGIHHKVCGEFISAEGVPYLEAAGIRLDVLGAATLTGFRLHGPKRSVAALLPRAAKGVSRSVLDEALLVEAERVGARVLRGHPVKTLGSCEGRHTVVTAETTLEAANLICATGKADFKPLPLRTGRDSGLVGFKMHLRLQPEALRALGNSVDLFVFQGGYGGLSPVEGETVNCCFLLRREHAKSLGRDWKKLAPWLASQNRGLADYLEGAEPLFPFPITVASVPYGFVRDKAVAEGLYCIGDQLAVIPSLTGDGMSIALMSARKAAESILGGGTSVRFHEEMARVLNPQVGFGYHVHRLFRSPSLCDWSTHLIRAWPGLVHAVFEATRTPSLEAAANEGPAAAVLAP